MAEEGKVQEANPEIETMVASLEAIKAGKDKLDAADKKVRAKLKELMEGQNILSYEVGRFDANGAPAKGPIARLDDNMDSSIDVAKVEKLLTDEEKKPYTSFSIGIGKLEEALKKGTIKREKPEEEAAIRACITRTTDGKKLVVTLA